MIEPMEKMPDEHCDICHRLPENCLCPPCPDCGEIGNRKCYLDHSIQRITDCMEYPAGGQSPGSEAP